MKTALAAAIAVAVAGSGGAAYASDFYAPGQYFAPGGLKPGAYVQPCWTGFYVGGHIGGAWTDVQTTDVDRVWSVYGNQWSSSEAAVIGGGQAGYNFQIGGFVVGVEGDFGGTAFARSHQIAPFLQVDTSSGFYADVTGRLGYAVRSALFYVKGGWAYSDTNLSVWDRGFSTRCVTSACSVSNGGLEGWTIGGGIEYKLLSTWSAKVEYRYFDFGSVTGSLYPLVPDSRFERNLTANAVTVGVNYYLNNIYAPLK